MSAELTKTSRIEAEAQACLQDFSLWRSHASEYTNTLTCQLVYSNTCYTNGNGFLSYFPLKYAMIKADQTRFQSVLDMFYR